MSGRVPTDGERWTATGGPDVAARASVPIVVGRFLGTVVVTLRGAFDDLAAKRLGATLQDLIDGQGNLAIALDLGRVSQLGPSGVQVLCAAASGLERKGGRLWLGDPPEGILRVLNAGGLSRLVGYPRTLEADSRCLPAAQNSRSTLGSCRNSGSRPGSGSLTSSPMRPRSAPRVN
jgi:anti-anti-sigma factor